MTAKLSAASTTTSAAATRRARSAASGVRRRLRPRSPGLKRCNAAARDFDLGLADIGHGVERLAVEVGFLDPRHDRRWLSRPTPAPARSCITGQPSPPAPTTRTDAAASRACPASPTLGSTDLPNVPGADLVGYGSLILHFSDESSLLVQCTFEVYNDKNSHAGHGGAAETSVLLFQLLNEHVVTVRVDMVGQMTLDFGAGRGIRIIPDNSGRE